MREYYHYKRETQSYHWETVTVTACDDSAANRVGSAESAVERVDILQKVETRGGSWARGFGGIGGPGKARGPTEVLRRAGLHVGRPVTYGDVDVVDDSCKEEP